MTETQIGRSDRGCHDNGQEAGRISAQSCDPGIPKPRISKDPALIFYGC